jgi:eukaryotic translation initiation factor 2C
MQNTKSQKLSLRPGFALEGSFDAIVYTNHFAIELPTKDMFEYKIEGIVTPEQEDEERIPSAARRQELMEMAIASSTMLQNAGDTFATDCMEKIVAWTPLHQTDGNNASAHGALLEDIQITIPSTRQGQAAVTRTVQLKYIGLVPIKTLTKACSGDIDALPLVPKAPTGMTVVEAVNIIVGHATRSPTPGGQVQTFRLGGNKFFSTSAPSTIDLDYGLECCKGFFFTLRYGMGKPLLNVSTAATAFYKSISVAAFMNQFCKIGGQKTNFTAADLKNLRAALKGVRVSIKHENRTKAITDVADLTVTPSGTSFTDKNNVVQTVYSHLAAIRGMCASLEFV